MVQRLPVEGLIPRGWRRWIQKARDRVTISSRPAISLSLLTDGANGCFSAAERADSVILMVGFGISSPGRTG
jgi:hypothetical protein